LSSYKAWNKALEIGLAIITPGAIGSWAIWQIGLIQPFWTAIAALAALGAVVKPFLQWPEEIERYSKLYAGYNDLYQDLDRLVANIALKGGVTPEMLTVFRSSQARGRTLAILDDPRPKEKLRKECRKEVNKEKPLNNFWKPPKNAAG